MAVFHCSRRVEFADTDMAGIVHFARFFVYMETAEHELLRSLGSTVHFQHDGEEIGWPRVAVSCRYQSPARLGDVLDLAVTVGRLGRTSITYRFEVSCGERRLADGEIRCICCVLEGEGKLRPTPIPAFLAERLADYLLPATAPTPVTA